MFPDFSFLDLQLPSGYLGCMSSWNQSKACIALVSDRSFILQPLPVSQDAELSVTWLTMLCIQFCGADAHFWQTAACRLY